MAQQPSISEAEKKRVALLIKIYRLVNQKYNLGFQEIRYHLQEASRWGFEGLDELQKVLDRNDTLECLEAHPDLPGGAERDHHFARAV